MLTKVKRIRRIKSAHGGFHNMEDVTKYLNDPANADEIKKMKDKIDTESFKNFLLNKSKEKFIGKKVKIFASIIQFIISKTCNDRLTPSTFIN